MRSNLKCVISLCNGKRQFIYSQFSFNTYTQRLESNFYEYIFVSFLIFCYLKNLLLDELQFNLERPMGWLVFRIGNTKLNGQNLCCLGCECWQNGLVNSTYYRLPWKMSVFIKFPFWALSCGLAPNRKVRLGMSIGDLKHNNCYCRTSAVSFNLNGHSEWRNGYIEIIFLKLIWWWYTFPPSGRH